MKAMKSLHFLNPFLLLFLGTNRHEKEEATTAELCIFIFILLLYLANIKLRRPVKAPSLNCNEQEGWGRLFMTKWLS